MNVIDNLLFNIGTIASVPKGKRISTTKEFIAIEEESLTQGIWRWRNVEDRYKAARLICREIRILMEISNRIMDSRSLYVHEPVVENPDDIMVASRKTERALRVEEIKKIREGLQSSIIGIDNLCETYDGDANVTGLLLPLIKEIAIHVGTITELLLRFGE